MKILYVANHNQANSNDDEGAITHAFQILGHQVERVREVNGRNACRIQEGCDFLLFHKWSDWDTLQAITIPRVFWYFDLVTQPEVAFRGRNQTRQAWMHQALKLVHTGFCTDGEWVSLYPDKLRWLPQGCDERIAGQQFPTLEVDGILFTGTKRGGQVRSGFVDEMQARYGARFRHVESQLHGKDLAQLIQSYKIVVAPDGPIMEHYWSNRIYLTLGFGGFLLHPWNTFLAERHYTDGGDICFYRNRPHLHALIEFYRTNEAARNRIARSGMETTLKCHTYRRRCEQLITTLKERGL